MRLDATERRLQEASELLQAQIAERKRVEESFEYAREYTESIVETIREPLIVLTPDLKSSQRIVPSMKPSRWRLKRLREDLSLM